MHNNNQRVRKIKKTGRLDISWSYELFFHVSVPEMKMDEVMKRLCTIYMFNEYFLRLDDSMSS